MHDIFTLYYTCKLLEMAWLLT